jgi:hypothetical protein
MSEFKQLIFDGGYELIAALKPLLERLAPEGGITEEHDTFSHSISCVFCKAPFIYELKGIIHESDCAWREARKLLEELK